MKKILITLCIAVAIMAITIACLFNRVSKLDRIVVIDVVKVFNEFHMKKDMEQKTEVKLREYTQHIDSLEGLYKAVLNKQDTTGAGYVKSLLDNTRGNATQFYELSNKEINEQVWNRLNPLLDDYGRNNNIRILMGANGMGSVLYRDTTADETSKVIEFVNKQYENLN